MAYSFKKLSFCGIDSSDFSLYTGDSSGKLMRWESVKTVEYAEILSKLFEEKLTGKAMPVASEMTEGGHYIVLCASSLDVTEYSVKIEGGNVYITGGYLTIDNAYKAFLEEMLGYTEEGTDSDRVLDLTAADNKFGTLDFKVPYNKKQLFELFEEANKRDDMIISGTHVFGDKSNGFELQHTRDIIEEKAENCCCAFEIDPALFCRVEKNEAGEDILVDTLTDYDLSRVVSEAYNFISDGGILSICMHLTNPTDNKDVAGRTYKGNIGGNDNALVLMTEGTPLNAKFRQVMEPTLRVVRLLKKYNIPFLFRPLHEINGDWFWWCYRQRDGGEVLRQDVIVKLWRYIHYMLTEEEGVKDLALWVYAPSPMFDNLHCYPGDEYVDIMGMDWYCGDLKPKAPTVPHPYGHALSKNKPMILAETGVGPQDMRPLYDCLDLLEFMKDLMRNGMNVAYFSTWTFRGSIANMIHNKELLESPEVLNLADLQKYWAK